MEWYEQAVSINTGDYFGSYDAPVSIFPSPSFEPDGSLLIDSRSNTSFWNFDQSKISSSFQNVIGSVVEAGAKTGLQVAQSSMNKGTTQQGLFGDFARNFRSTQTGAQINAAGYATQFQNFLYNPMVWLGAVLLVVLFIFMRK